MGNYGPVITFLLGVISILLAVLVRQFNALAAKMDAKVDASTCSEFRKATETTLCKASAEWTKASDGIWGAINNHSHTGIPDTSRVIR